MNQPSTCTACGMTFPDFPIECRRCHSTLLIRDDMARPLAAIHARTAADERASEARRVGYWSVAL